MAVVTVVFDYETTSVEERMMKLRHEYEGSSRRTFTVTSASATAWNCSCWRAS